MAENLGHVTDALVRMGVNLSALPDEVKNQLVAVAQAGLGQGLPSGQIAQQLAGALGGGAGGGVGGATPADVQRYEQLLEAGYPEAEARARAFPNAADKPDFSGLPPEIRAIAEQSYQLERAGLSSNMRDRFLMGAGLGGGGGAAQPSFQAEVNKVTGEGMSFNPRSGRFEGTGQQLDFAGVDPRDTMAEDARLAGNRDAISIADLMDRAGRGRADSADAGAQWRTSLAEQARQADQSAILDEFRTRANLIPAFGQIALGAAQQQREILSTGKDYLARAFGQANRASPLGLVTQADLTNNLMGQLGQVQGLMPGGRVTGNSSYQAPSAYEGAPAFEMPGQTAFTRPGSAQPAGGWGGGNGASAAPSGGGGAGGGAVGQTAPRPAAASAPAFQWPSGDEAMGAPRGPLDAGPQPRQPFQWGPPEEGYLDSGPAQAPAQPYNRWGGASTPRSGLDLPGLLAQLGLSGGGLKQGYRGYEAGGVTKEPVFITGEDGYELNIQTPEGVMVLPNEVTRKLVTKDGKVKGYEDGTSAGRKPAGARAMAAFNAPFEGEGGVDYGMMAGSLFGGPSGGGGVGKGAMKITPELVQKALAEMKSSDLLRRLAMDEQGGGDLIGKMFSRMSPIETRQHGLRAGASPDMLNQALGKFSDMPRRTGGEAFSRERLNSLYQQMLDARAGGDDAVADMIGNDLAGLIGPGRQAVDNIEPGTSPFARMLEMFGPGAADIPGFADGTWGMTAAVEDFNRTKNPGFLTPYGGSGGGWDAPSQSRPRPQGAPGFPGMDPTKPATSMPFLPGGADRGNTVQDYWMNVANMQRRQQSQPGMAPKQYTQEELIQLARSNAPPRVMSVRNGQLPQAPDVTGGLPGFRAPTLRMMSALNQDDFGALNTLLNTESKGLTDANEIMWQGMGMAQPYRGRQARAPQFSFAL